MNLPSGVISLGRMPYNPVLIRLGLLSCLFAFWACVRNAIPAEHQSLPSESGQFYRVYWYERGLDYGNPKYDGRFRVNSPEAVVHPEFGKRIEARENGLMLIRAEEDLSLLTGAELYLELWGGHPGTANKRVTINGRSTYPLPRVGTEEKNCTYSYPALPLKITDLVNGYNALQFACDLGSTFWGHFIVDNACLRLALTNRHPALARAGFADFTATVTAIAGAGDGESIRLTLATSASTERIASVDFQGFYAGYDENGNGQGTDWHGFTRARAPMAMLGTSTAAPFAVAWNTSLLPSQDQVAVRAVVHFKGETNLVFLTPPARGLRIPERNGRKVALYPARDLPQPFWSRANKAGRCVIELDLPPEQIERAELHVVTWTGGPGNVKNYFTLNGHPFPVAEGTRHEVIYSRLPVDPKVLKQGANQIELLSDTEHHGIEVFLPGPALMVRSKGQGR